MSAPILLSLGSVNADFQVRTPRPLRAGETLQAHDFVRLGGGKAANVAFLAHRLGRPALLLGRVGDDDLREQALGPLRRAGLDLGYVTTAPAMPTAVSMIAVPPGGKKSIVLAGNANDAWDDAATSTALAAIEAAPAGSVLVADCEITQAVVIRAVTAARNRGLRVVLDPAPAERAGRDVLRQCHALTPDAREASALAETETGTPEGAGRAASILAGLGVEMVCVKLGDGGCVLAHAGRLTHIPPVDIKVVDSTGAGDAFTGAFAVALLEEQAPKAAALFATAASHLAVTGYGSQEAYPTREQIQAFLPRLAARVHELRT